MTIRFLRYSAVANNLTSKLTESYIAEMISSHYPAYVQRTISAGVRTIRDALNLLNKLESLKQTEKGNRTQGHPPKTELTEVTRTLNHVRTEATRPDKDFRR